MSNQPRIVLAVARPSPIPATTLVSPPYDRDDAAEVAYDMMHAAQSVLDAGGLSVACEASGAAHPAARWRELTEAARRGLETPKRAGLDFWRPLAAAYLLSPVVTPAGDAVTRGAHLLGRPDAAVALADCEGLDRDAASEAASLLETFLLYLLAECGFDDLREGDAFRRHEARPRYRLAAERSPLNPYGCWRLVRARSARVTAGRAPPP